MEDKPERTTYESVVYSGQAVLRCFQHSTLADAERHAQLEAEHGSIVGIYRVVMRGKQLAQSDLVGAYGGLEDRPDLRGAMMRAARDVTRRRVDMMEYRGSQVLVEDEG